MIELVPLLAAVLREQSGANQAPSRVIALGDPIEECDKIAASGFNVTVFRVGDAARIRESGVLVTVHGPGDFRNRSVI